MIDQCSAPNTRSLARLSVTGALVAGRSAASRHRRAVGRPPDPVRKAPRGGGVRPQGVQLVSLPRLGSVGSGSVGRSVPPLAGVGRWASLLVGAVPRGLVGAASCAFLPLG